jgi:hypothetical protein
MRRIRIQPPGRRRERPWLQAQAAEPRDPEIVRAKALDRSRHPQTPSDRGARSTPPAGRQVRVRRPRGSPR